MRQTNVSLGVCGCPQQAGNFDHLKDLAVDWMVKGAIFFSAGAGVYILASWLVIISKPPLLRGL